MADESCRPCANLIDASSVAQPPGDLRLLDFRKQRSATAGAIAAECYRRDKCHTMMVRALNEEDMNEWDWVSFE